MSDPLEAVVALTMLRRMMPPSRHWLIDSVESALSAAYSGRPAPRPPSVTPNRHARNAALRAAAAMLTGSCRSRAEQMAKIITTYVRRDWPTDSRSAECPERLRGKVEEHIWRALVAYPTRFPCGYRQLVEIIRD